MTMLDYSHTFFVYIYHLNNYFSFLSTLNKAFYECRDGLFLLWKVY